MLIKTPSVTKFISRTILAGGLASGIAFSGLAQAAAPGGPNCGWGNLMFAGDSGKFAHFGANLFNGSTFNQYIGLLIGTNGCKTDEALTYGGKSLFALSGFIDEIAVDIAKGEGEALSALSIAMGIEASDRKDFNNLLHTNFSNIFHHENMDSADIFTSIQTVLKTDSHFKSYVS